MEIDPLGACSGEVARPAWLLIKKRFPSICDELIASMLVATPNLLELLEPGAEKICPLTGHAQSAVRQKEAAKKNKARRRSIKPPFYNPEESRTRKPKV
ncbi:MAG: hypothetical protein JO260_01040 [Acidobacteria bacterium]|nr:hypothetical protein [Acidobacteriota bacterium]